MKRATAVLRHYSESDAAMRQNMRTMCEHFTASQAAFQAFNPGFDAEFGPHWLAAIDVADAAPTHEVRAGELKEDTAEVTTVMDRARQAVQTLFYYVGQTFPHNAGRLDQYGRRSYEKARNQHDQMRTLLQTAFASATRDQAELVTKGYSAAQLAALGALVGQLADTNTTQEVTKGQNTEGSDDYLTVQNLAYGFGQEVGAAAKVLFADDAATRALFRLGSGPAAADAERHELAVDANSEKTVTFATPLLDATTLHLRLLAPAAGQQAVVQREEPVNRQLAAGLTLTFDLPELDARAPDLGPAGQVVLVRNTGPAPVRVEIAIS